MATAVFEPSLNAGPAIRPAGQGATRCTTRAATRARGRLLALLALLVIAGAVLLAVGRGPASAAGPSAPPPTVEPLVVAPGQTVWDLVVPHAPAGTDPAVYVAEVVAANDLDPLRVQPGTVVRLP